MRADSALSFWPSDSLFLTGEIFRVTSISGTVPGAHNRGLDFLPCHICLIFAFPSRVQVRAEGGKVFDFLLSTAP
jgi:hypothetical protein